MEAAAASSSSSNSSAASDPVALSGPEEAGAAASENRKQSPKDLLKGNHVRWSAAASGTAALLTCCMLHPLDLIKTRMQVAAITQGAIPRYPSTTGAASGLVSGVVVTGLTHPLWLAKARMEMQAKETQVNKGLSVYYQEKGLNCNSLCPLFFA
ncbi:hypothetical protein Emag_005080 [Eimeria magna]